MNLRVIEQLAKVTLYSIFAGSQTKQAGREKFVGSSPGNVTGKAMISLRSTKRDDKTKVTPYCVEQQRKTQGRFLTILLDHILATRQTGDTYA